MSRLAPRDLIERYVSFWHPLLPFGDAFVRELNLRLCERFCFPLASRSDPSRRAFINELSFELCRRAYPSRAARDLEPEIEQIARSIHERVALYEGASTDSFALSTVEKVEAFALCDNLKGFLLLELKPTRIEFYPRLPGLGVIGEIDPDILTDTILVEVKSGERSFRIIDVRQILLYASVAFSQRFPRLDAVCLVNPRQGLFYRASMDDFCRSLSGRSSVDLFAELNFLLTQEGVY